MTEAGVTYCEGWNPADRQEYGVITEAEADARDRDGAQYAVLLHQSGRPVALIQIAWTAGYLGVWQFDDQARRVREFDFRVTSDPGRLHWYRFRGWLPRSPYDPEYFEKRPQLALKIRLDGNTDALLSSRGRGTGHSTTIHPIVPTKLRAISKPSFGDWQLYVGRPLFDPETAPPALSPSTRLSRGADSPAPETSQHGWTPLASPLTPVSAADLQDTRQEWALPADCSRFTFKLLANLERVEAQVFAEDPVEMPHAPTLFEPQTRPELRFPDHDRAVPLDAEVAVKTRDGNTWRESRSYGKALAAYSRALELDPEYTPAIAGRGDASRLAGYHTEAVDDLSRALDLHPGLTAAYISRARTYYALGQYSEALADYDRFEEIGFTGTGSGFSPVIDRPRRGDIYRRLGRLDEALADFDHALRVSPDDAIALAGRGDTLRLLGRHQEAVADLTRAIELEPDLGEAYASRGASYQALGRDEEARADLERKRTAEAP